MVLNDEGHHCWRAGAERRTRRRPSGCTAEEEDTERAEEEARVWLDGLDRINNADCRNWESLHPARVDLSATPFYLAAAAIPRAALPVARDRFRAGGRDRVRHREDSPAAGAGRPGEQGRRRAARPKYFRLWKHITEALDKKKELRPNGRPKPEAAYREAEGALQTLYSNT